MSDSNQVKDICEDTICIGFLEPFYLNEIIVDIDPKQDLESQISKYPTLITDQKITIRKHVQTIIGIRKLSVHYKGEYD